MVKHIKQAICRIRNANQVVVGTGFLVSDRLVLTCAHVVNTALGRPRNSTEKPEVPIRLDFLFISEVQDDDIEAFVEMWVPMSPDGSGDIAVLRLDKEIPQGGPIGVIQTTEVIGDEFWGRKCRSFGFSRVNEEGVSIEGIMRMVGGHDWLQIDASPTTQYFPEQGFSGAPVWDEHNRLAGMAVRVDTSDLKVAYIIPIHSLIRHYPALEIHFHVQGITDTVLARISGGDYSAVLIKTPEDIPQRPTKFIGRESLLQRAREWLSRDRQVLFWGSSGTGKTALASAVMEEWFIRNGGGEILWLEVGNEEVNTIFEALTRPLNYHNIISEKTGEERIQVVRRILSNSEIKLMVLDNVWNGTALREVMKAVPDGIRVLVTSRQRYPLDKGEMLSVEELEEGEDRQLLEYYAHQDYSSDPSLAADADSLCIMLDRNAFALEVAGRNLRTTNCSPGELLTLIRNAPYKMAMPLGFAEEGRESFAALLEVSLDALDAATRSVFLAFGALFASNNSAQLLAMYMGSDEQDITGYLQDLHSRSLVQRIEGTARKNAHWRVRDLAYTYVRAQSSDEQRAQALSACLAYVQHYNPNQRENFKALFTELDSFIQATNWAMQAEKYYEVEQLAQNLYPATGNHFMRIQGFLSQSVTLLTNAARAAEEQGNTRNQLGFLGQLGNVHLHLGNYRGAIEYCERALAVARTTNSRGETGDILVTLGNAHRGLGEIDVARSFYKQALSVSQDVADKRTEANAMNGLGSLHARSGEYEEAGPYYDKAKEIAQEIEDRKLLANQLNDLGLYYQRWGDNAKARPLLEEALKICREIGDRVLESAVLGNLGMAQGTQPEALDISLELYQGALAIAEEVGNKANVGNQLGNIGGVYYRKKDYREALRYFEDVLKIARLIGYRQLEANTLNSVAATHIMLASGEYEQAAAYIRQAIEIAQASKNKGQEALLLENLGEALQGVGDYDQALEELYKARNVYSALGLKKDVEDVNKQIVDTLFRRVAKQIQERMEEQGDLVGVDIQIGNLGRNATVEFDARFC